MSNKNPKFDTKNMRCVVCGGKRGLIHKYGLKLCRRCFRESAPSIGFNKFS